MLPDIHIGRDAPIAAALILQLLSGHHGTLSELKASLPQWEIVKLKAPLAGLDPNFALAKIKAPRSFPFSSVLTRFRSNGSPTRPLRWTSRTVSASILPSGALHVFDRGFERSRFYTPSVTHPPSGLLFADLLYPFPVIAHKAHLLTHFSGGCIFASRTPSRSSVSFARPRTRRRRRRWASALCTKL